jgi:hypothetical protein
MTDACLESLSQERCQGLLRQGTIGRIALDSRVLAEGLLRGECVGSEVVGRVSDRFEVVCEIEPPTRPDLMHVRHQIGVLSEVASSFLIPDNHIGRATVSSIAVAHEVERMGGRSIACLNARDRNLLGFRRDLLTAAAYGVDQFLFVYGDRPSCETRRRLSLRSGWVLAR